ncbi:rod shape-determining protein MreC [Flavobacteriaceae bacterium 14752]|uniref:rod shape-determining protein MreC n=1 Tax=Mesohalobacter salilacus TaxID=2491711 RepID=UPI000F63889E|nr:rod shape-determining protein MreC [Flavobacteriaceae bacterium 14752]
MQQIIKFFIRNKVGILFVVLFAISIQLSIQSHTYHKSKWVSSTNTLSAFLLNIRYNVTKYFELNEENKKLQYENVYLKKRLHNAIQPINDSVILDSLYTFKPCYIISNSYSKVDNYVLINKGLSDGVDVNYAVSLPNGILGIVEKSTENYSRVISILNTNLSINAKLKASNHFGSLQWDGLNPNTIYLKDLPRSASFNIGDTIVTGSNSLIFPKDIPIGLIKDYELNENIGYYNIEVKLFEDMTNINHAYVIIPKKIKQAKSLINTNNE